VTATPSAWGAGGRHCPLAVTALSARSGVQQIIPCARSGPASPMPGSAGSSADSTEPPARLVSHDRTAGTEARAGRGASGSGARPSRSLPGPEAERRGAGSGCGQGVRPAGGTPRTSPGANTLPGGPGMPGTTHSRTTGSCRQLGAGYGRRSGRRKGLASCPSSGFASEGARPRTGKHRHCILAGGASYRPVADCRSFGR
jgi:hypothetical protein